MQLFENLKQFGLTDYEAKAYIALAKTGTASVTEVSQLCDVPRSNLYAVLEKLVEKGFADAQRGRPVLFKAVASEKILGETEHKAVQKLKDAKKQVIAELSTLGKEKNEVPALVWAVRGPDAVVKKTNEMLRRARKEVLINIPDLSMLEPVRPELEKTAGRGVKIKIVTGKTGPGFRNIALVRTKETHGTDIVCDDSEALIAPKIPVIAAWIDNPEVVLHVKDFMQLLWKTGKVLK